MDDFIESAKNIALLILGGAVFFGIVFLLFTIRGDRRHGKGK